MTEVVVKTEATRRAKLRSNCHHQQTNTQPFTGRMPFLSPDQQCQSTEGNSATVSIKTKDYFNVTLSIYRLRRASVQSGNFVKHQDRFWLDVSFLTSQMID